MCINWFCENNCNKNKLKNKQTKLISIDYRVNQIQFIVSGDTVLKKEVDISPYDDIRQQQTEDAKKAAYEYYLNGEENINQFNHQFYL